MTYNFNINTLSSLTGQRLPQLRKRLVVRVQRLRMSARFFLELHHRRACVADSAVQRRQLFARL